MSSRPRSLQTSEGTHLGAFGPTEWGLLAITAAIWGSSYLWIAIGLDSLHPGAVALVRLILGAAALWWVPGARRQVGRESWFAVFIVGAIGMAAPALLFALAEQRIDSGVAGMVQAATPLVVLVISILMLRRSPGPLQMLGLAIGFAGSLLLSWPSLTGSEAEPLGVAYAALAVVCYGVSSNILPPLIQTYGGPAIVLRALVVSAIVMTPLGVYGLSRSTFSWTAVVAMLILGVFGTGLARVFFAQLLGRAGAPRASLVSYVVPFVAVMLGVAFRDETVSATEISGLFVVLIAAFLISRAQRSGSQSDG